MCGKSPSIPQAKAPPAPIPQADAKMESRDTRQRAAAQGAQSGYQATMLTEGGDTSTPNTLSPVLGG